MNEMFRNGLLWLSIASGIIFILVGSMAQTQPLGKVLGPAGTEPLAFVDGQPVSKSLYLSIAGDGVSALEQSQIDRFIGEQILIKEALKQEVVFRDPRLRSLVLDAMREFVVSEKPVAVPSEAELRAFYLETIKEYTPPPRYQVRTVSVVKGEEPSEVLFADEATAQFLPLGILRRTLGQKIVDRLTTMDIDEEVVFDDGAQTIFVKLDGIRTNSAPDFEVVRRRVEEAWYVRAEDKAFDEYLSSLLASVDIKYVPE
jgi:hypothetical protein